ncbi:breast cancer protein [Xylariaceae sp. FL0255]|nr:breast cancer protein [Xylariaceae sp. FL0255]
MSRLGNWFRGSTPKSSSNASPAESQVDLRAETITLLQDAMRGADLIMNDDIDGAEERLKAGDSTFHSFGHATTLFMRCILGVEKTVMAKANARLSEVETTTIAELKKAERDPNNSSDRIYSNGSEYSLILAEIHLMSAVIGVLQESLTEAIKSFLKLRKAYLAVDAIIRAEEAYAKRKGLQSSTSIQTPTPPGTKMPGGFEDDEDLEFVEAEEINPDTPTPPEYMGHLDTYKAAFEEKLAELSLEADKDPGTLASPAEFAVRTGLSGGPDSEHFADPLDAFVHSGATMCFGVLLLLLSLIPPAFSRLLAIVGFRGDRERGIKLLWQSSKFDNINGAVAGLTLAAYYNGFLGFADILPSDADVKQGAITGYPKEGLPALLAKLRARYPDSALWKVEEARAKGITKDLDGALVILKDSKSKIKQVEALSNFEMALDSFYVRDWTHARDGFLRCIELNDWSPSLYYYMAGTAELENYRNVFHSSPKDETQANLHKKKAEEFFRKAPAVAGRKKLLSRPLPFEQFAVRRVQKWEDRAKILGIDLADAAGISPAQEMVYLWNGTKKMQPQQLERASEDLSWDRLTCSDAARKAIQTEADEEVSKYLFDACLLRNLGKLEEAESLVMALINEKSTLKGLTKDEYALPAACYDMAVIAWVKGQNDGSQDGVEQRVRDCQHWLDRVAHWESYILDARIGMRATTGMETLKWYKRKHGISG